MFAIGEDFISQHMLDHVVDAQRGHLAVIDEHGTILAVNRAWMRFAVDNDVDDPARVGPGANYLEVCRQSASRQRSAQRALRGIEAVLHHESDQFEMDYACPGYGRRNWFTMEVTPLRDSEPMALIQHTDLTRRKVVERRLLKRLHRLADQMTDIEQAERSRLASQLHDHLQQLLVAARMALSGQTVKQVEGAAADRMKQACDYLDEAVQATRTLSVELRPLTLEQAGLPQALEQLVEQHRQLYHIEVEVDVSPGFPELPYPLAAFVYHATREMLFNAIKHAEATRQEVSLRHDDGRITLAVSDNGRGMDPACIHCGEDEAGGTGLATIRQRLQYFGGRIDVDTAPGQGTTIWLTIPKRSGRMR